jgi:hypothetical protein
MDCDTSIRHVPPGLLAFSHGPRIAVGTAHGQPVRSCADFETAPRFVATKAESAGLNDDTFKDAGRTSRGQPQPPTASDLAGLQSEVVALY